jgi:GTP cyclohydrolase I
MTRTGPALRVTRDRASVDIAAASRAAADFLSALGIEIDREDLRETLRPQVQERLTKQVAECLAARLRAQGVGVVLEAEHSCMTLRGVRAHGAKTVTSALLGTLRADPRSRAEFFALAGVPS